MHARFIIATEFFGFMGFGISKRDGRDGRDGRREEEDLSFFLFFFLIVYISCCLFFPFSLLHTHKLIPYFCVFFLLLVLLFTTHTYYPLPYLST